MGVVVVDAESNILFMNSLGTEYLAGNDGLTMSPTGLCRASRPVETAELHRLVKMAVNAGGETVGHALAVTREKADRPLSVVIAPLPAEHHNGRVAVLLISDPERQTLPPVDTVAKLFDLTDAEARLALALSEGQRIEDAAEKLGITLNSARTYLKRIFSKTDVTRQAELVRLILAAPTLLNLGAAKRPQRPSQTS
jgi:DNA-binding CsgD family transcriptional regulator